MNRMMYCEYVGNFSYFYLLIKLFTIHYFCGFFLSDNEYLRYFIHNFLFWCKINKFIFFFSKK